MTQTMEQKPEQVARETSPAAILARLDAILAELVTLRQTVWAMAQEQERETEAEKDLVSQLAGSLGPAAPDEFEYFYNAVQAMVQEHKEAPSRSWADELYGSLGQGSWDELDSNADIEVMRYIAGSNS